MRALALVVGEPLLVGHSASATGLVVLEDRADLTERVGAEVAVVVDLVDDVTAGVGLATTRSVVVSLLSVFIANAVLTALFFF